MIRFILAMQLVYLIGNSLSGNVTEMPIFMDTDFSMLVTVSQLDDTYEYQLPFVCSFDQQEALRYYPSNCGMLQEEFEDDWNWALRSGRPPSPGTGPHADLSSTGQGYYLYFESSTPALEGHFAVFSTPWLSASHENICISFWFNMEGDIGMGLFDVFLDIPGQSEPYTIFQTDGAHGKKWLPFYEQVRIPVQHSFRIRFIATRGKSFRSDIAVDEIVVKEVRDDESCVPLARYPNIVTDSVAFCDIDSGNCRLEQENLKQSYVWEVTSTDKYKFGSGPDLGDHTKGKYGKYLIAPSEVGEPGSSARIRIPLDIHKINRTDPRKSDLCVDFYYMTFGRQLGELKVNLWYWNVEHEFISISHPTNRAWYPFGKILHNFAEKNVSLVLEAIRGGSNMSDIAVDDIHVYYCAAKEHPLNDVTHADVLTPLCRGGAVPCPEKDGCMLPEYLCDGTPHCNNGSDEKFCTQHCGVPMVEASTIVTKIVYGQTAKAHSWPWQVALIDKTDETQFCGGSIIHPFWVLTAAHCLAEYSNKENGRMSNMIVRIGEHNLLRNIEPSQIDYFPSGLFMHPEFNKPYRANDFGLIRLRQPIVFRQEIQPVCLPWFSNIPVGSTCVVTGWGHTALTVSQPTEQGLRANRLQRHRRTAIMVLPPKYLASHGSRDFSFRKTIRSLSESIRYGDSTLRRFTTVLTHTTDLQQLYLPILPDEICRNASQYAGQLSESMLCAGYLQSMIGDSCHGDSGGPLTCKKNDGSWEVHGVTSFGGLRCAEEGHPGVYSRVVHALDWISQVLGEDARLLKKKRGDAVEGVGVGVVKERKVGGSSNNGSAGDLLAVS